MAAGAAVESMAERADRNKLGGDGKKVMTDDG
jgi:hypothetical protein